MFVCPVTRWHDFCLSLSIKCVTQSLVCLFCVSVRYRYFCLFINVFVFATVLFQTVWYFVSNVLTPLVFVLVFHINVTGECNVLCHQKTVHCNPVLWSLLWCYYCLQYSCYACHLTRISRLLSCSLSLFVSFWSCQVQQYFLSLYLSSSNKKIKSIDTQNGQKCDEWFSSKSQNLSVSKFHEVLDCWYLKEHSKHWGHLCVYREIFRGFHSSTQTNVGFYEEISTCLPRVFEKKRLSLNTWQTRNKLLLACIHGLFSFLKLLFIYIVEKLKVTSWVFITRKNYLVTKFREKNKTKTLNHIYYSNMSWLFRWMETTQTKGLWTKLIGAQCVHCTIYITISP